MVRYFVLIWMVLCGLTARSQDSGTVPPPDTSHQSPVVRQPPVQRPRVTRRDTTIVDSLVARDTTVRNDSVTVFEIERRPTIALFTQKTDTPFFANHPFYRFTDPVHYSITIRKWQGKEAIFYCMIALLLFFAFIKNGFSRYMVDLLATFFQTSVKQRQVKEQLLQNPLPSLLLNLFFTLSIGMFLALVFQYYKLGLELNFWLLYLYCVLGLITIYISKFVSLKFLGWIFQVSEPIENYAFIVFTTNKIIGIALLPLLVLLVFTDGVIYQASMSLSVMIVFGLLAYRFFLSFVSVRRQIRISFFHFLLYLFAFELVPLLLINKLLFRFLGETS